MKVVALIDGEHHPGVTRDALDRLAATHELCAVVFVGGGEKVAPAVLEEPAAHYGREVVVASNGPRAALRELAAACDLDAVVDLCDEPVLDGAARFRLASVALHLGLDYGGPGFRLAAPRIERLPLKAPVLAVIGTGKRTGKTAVAGHYASLLREWGNDPVVVSMGRGGPRRPELVRAGEGPSLAELLEMARAGGHAASDYLENAVLAGVSCVGCRRCGGGLAGEAFDSNVLEGAELALTLDPDVLVLEGSGATVPPIEAHRTVCVTGAARARREALSYLGPYRLLRSDLVVVTGADLVPAAELDELREELGEWRPGAPVVGCALDLEPAEPVPSGARTALFTTAPPELEGKLRERLSAHGLEPRVLSSNLARRAELERDLERAANAGCDVYLTELKAAAIEVVAERAERQGALVVLVRNRPLSLPGEPDLDQALRRLLDEAGGEVARSEPMVAGGRRA